MDPEQQNPPEIPPTNAPNPPMRQDGLPFIDESIENVGQGTSDYIKRHPNGAVAVIVLTVAVEVALVVFHITDPRAYIIAPLLIPLLGYHWVRSSVQHEFMQQFAAANGYIYTQKGALNGLDGTLFQIGHNKSIADVVSGQYGGRSISLFTYTYVTGYGKSAQTHHDTIFELQFDIVMPDILLENGSHGFGESLFSGLSGKNFVKLEGDFNKYFSLSVPRGYEIEALEIFTPDVMEELIEKAKLLSLEIVNGHCFVYSNGIVSTKKNLYALYELAQYFDQKLAPLLTRMKGSVQAMEEERAKNK
jgi:hypothetical protein